MKQKSLIFIFLLLSTLTASGYHAKINGIYYDLDYDKKQASVTYKEYLLTRIAGAFVPKG